MNGGGGYTPDEVGNMSLDQLWFRLCDTEILKRKTGFRVEKISGGAARATLKPNKDGLFRGRDINGNPILGTITGKSLNRRLMEAAEAEKKQKEKQERRRKRRERRENRDKKRRK